MGSLLARIPFVFWVLFFAAALIGPQIGFGVFFIIVVVYIFITKSLILGGISALLLLIFWSDFQELESAMGGLIVFAFVILVISFLFKR